MSHPEDKMTSKPPGDEPSSGKVPPTLRRKFDEEVDEAASDSNAANIIGLVMLVGIVVLGGLFWTSLQRSKVEEKQKAVAAKNVADEAARADSILKAEQERIYAARADSLKAEEAKHPKPKTPPAVTATQQPAAGGGQATPPPPPAKFGIDVGSFLSEDRAKAEMGKLTAATSLAARVVSKSEDGGTSYHVLLGEFTARKEADKKANELIVASTIREATVTKLK